MHEIAGLLRPAEGHGYSQGYPESGIARYPFWAFSAGKKSRNDRHHYINGEGRCNDCNQQQFPTRLLHEGNSHKRKKSYPRSGNEMHGCGAVESAKRLPPGFMPVLRQPLYQQIDQRPIQD